MSAKILEGIRVIDFTSGLSGPTATMILGDLGADVIKIERPTGDEQRTDTDSDKVGVTAIGFVTYNRNKRSTFLDLRTHIGREVAHRLTDNADVIVQNFRPGVMDRLGFGYGSIAEVNPSVVYCSISGFGSRGPLAPRAANDVVIQAYSGLMSITGAADGPPVRAHGYPADITSGVWAALGTVAAILHRERTGEGQHVEVSMMDTVLSSLSRVFARYLESGVEPQRLGGGSDISVPNNSYPTSDGWVTLSATSDWRWAKVCSALGIEELATSYPNRRDRWDNRALIDAAIAARTMRLTSAQAEKLLSEHGASCSQIRSISQVAADQNFSAAFIDVPADMRTVKVVGSPLKFSRTPTAVGLGVPAFGEHNEDVLRELGFSDTEIPEMVRRMTHFEDSALPE